jgi:CheY-like chemotaxis protein
MTRSVVLIVDDVEATRSGLAQLLQLLGYATEEARNGAEGLEKLRGNPRIAVVVLDLMPGPTGIWFREEQLKDPAIAEVPVIVFTGAETSDVLTKALRVTEVLHKPVSAGRCAPQLAATARLRDSSLRHPPGSPVRDHP